MKSNNSFDYKIVRLRSTFFYIAFIFIFLFGNNGLEAQTVPFPGPTHEGLFVKNIHSFDFKDNTKLVIGLWIQARILYNFSNIPGPGGTNFTNTEHYDFFRQRFREAFNVTLVKAGNDARAGVYMQFEQRGGWGGSSPWVNDPRALGPIINPYNFLQARGMRFGFIFYKPSEHFNVAAGIIPLIDQVGRTLFDADWDFSVGGIALGGKIGSGDYRLSYVRLIDGVGSYDNTQIGLNSHLGLVDYNTSINESFEIGIHVYGLKIPEDYKLSLPESDTTQWQLWYGVTSSIKLKNATVKTTALVNSGKTNFQRHNGLNFSIESDFNLGKSNLGIYGVYTTGDKLNQRGEANIQKRFVTLHQIVGTNGFWGYTHIFLPNGPSDVNDLGLKIGNNGAGLISLQSKLDFSVLGDKLDGQLFTGWFRASAARNNSQNMGLEVGGMLVYALAKYLKIELGGSYAKMGKFYGNDPDNIFEIFSRIQFTW